MLFQKFQNSISLILNNWKRKKNWENRGFYIKQITANTCNFHQIVVL